jgi:hypothetical protein
MLITDIIIVVIIRSAASADLARIQRICGDELDLEPDPGQLPLILARSAGRFGVVAEADGDIIGACYGSPGSGPAASPPSGCVDLLAVARSASGSGVGKAMLGTSKNGSRNAARSRSGCAEIRRYTCGRGSTPVTRR